MELATAVIDFTDMFSKFVGSFFVLEEIYSICHNEEKIKTLTDTVNLVRGVLSDLQRIQTPTESVIICYNRLREEFLNAEDFLDRVQTIKKREDYEARKMKQNTLKRPGEPLSHAPHKMINVAGKTVRRFFSALNQPYYAFKEHKEIKEINAQFEAISKNLKSFEVKGKEPGSTSEEMHRDARARGSIVDVTRLIGRDEDKKIVVELLLRSCADERRIPVISVVGIGGMGKTTVAQLVYGDQDWQDQFAMKLWVSDSKKYKLEQLLKHMLKSIDPATNVDYLAEDQLGVQFINKIRGKSFFLVLDDVDNENPRSWEQLELLLNHGNRVDSRILLTTRSREVAKVVRSSGLIHELKGLSDEDSLELFERFAFQESSRDGISDELVNQIVEKCCGVPLALKVIGSFLYRKDKREWKRVRNSNSLANIDEKKELLPVLKISYDDLDPTVKQCFSLCAVFPKNSVITADILRHLWVTNIHFKTAEGETLEDICEKSSRILYSRCFLEVASASNIGFDVRRNTYCRTNFKMHDLMYDLAQKVAGEEICIVDPNLKVETVEEKIRHLFITYGTPNFQLKGNRLRSIICSEGAKMQNMFSPSLVSKCPFLRVLDLSNCGIGNLTDSVGELIHLRYLNLARNNFQTLPKSITKLINLRHLDLESCASLTHLPSGMDALISLEVLDLFCCYNLVELPTGIEKITHLKAVIFAFCPRLGVMPSGMGALLPVCHDAVFKVGHPGSSSHAQLEELGPISDLPKEFAIILPKNITSKAATQDGEAFLLNKKRLRSLRIEWEHNPRLEEEVPAIHEDILAKLQPSINLEAFSLGGYQSMTFPPWVAQHGFASVLPNLGNICIRNCRRCRYLPSLSRLECLTSLTLAHLSSLEYIQENLLAAPFCLPKLEYLDLHDLPELKGWCRVLADGANDNDGEDIQLMLPQSFPCLTIVSLLRCPNFPDPSVLFSLNNPNLSFLFFCDNGKLQLPKKKNGSWAMTFSEIETEVAPRYMTGSLRAVSDRLTDLCIKNCDRLKTVTGLQHLTGLRCLEILSCPNFTWGEEEKQQSVGHGIESTSLHTAHHPNMPWSCLTSLQELRLHWLPKMVRLPEGLQFLTSLQKLRISECKDFLIHHPHIPWSCPTSLRELDLSTLPKVVGLEGVQFLTSLQKLRIDKFENLLIHPDMPWSCLTSLQELCLCGLPKMVSLPEGLQFLTSLQKLRIDECVNLLIHHHDMPWSCLTSLQQLFLWSLPKMVSLPEGLQFLTSLQVLRISGCKNLLIHHHDMPWSCLTSLQQLEFSEIPNMVTLPEGLQFLTSLQKIEIFGCENLLIPEWLHKTFECTVFEDDYTEWSKKGTDACSTSTSV